MNLEQYRLGGLYKREKFLNQLLKDPASVKIAEKLTQLHLMEAKVSAARNDPLRKKDEGMGTMQHTEKNSTSTPARAGFPRGVQKIMSESISKQNSFDNNMQTLNVRETLVNYQFSPPMKWSRIMEVVIQIWWS